MYIPLLNHHVIINKKSLDGDSENGRLDFHHAAEDDKVDKQRVYCMRKSGYSTVHVFSQCVVMVRVLI